MRKLLFAFTLIVLCFAGSGFAQAKKPKVLKYTAPFYPPAALAMRLSEEIVVTVKIDGQGKVIEAKTESGHPLFRQSSVGSARRWIFSADKSVAEREVRIFFNFRISEKYYGDNDKVKFKKPYRLEITAGKPVLEHSARRNVNKF
ncbi:MAG TPA: TonB family protein [Pyrinomonadaceae bacterium]|jgi:TonB family protein